MASDEHSPVVTATVHQLRQFLSGLLRWNIAAGTGLGAPNIVSINTDGNPHPVDLNATYLVSKLNFKNRLTNTGTLYVGSDPGSTGGLPGIQLSPGMSVSPPWTTPSKWFYTVGSAGANDVYEIWWSS